MDRRCVRFSPGQNDFLQGYLAQYEEVQHDHGRLQGLFTLIWVAYRRRFGVLPRHERLVRMTPSSTDYRIPTKKALEAVCFTGGSRGISNLRPPVACAERKLEDLENLLDSLDARTLTPTTSTLLRLQDGLMTLNASSAHIGRRINAERSWNAALMRDSEFWALVLSHNPSTIERVIARTGQHALDYILTDDHPVATEAIRAQLPATALAQFKPARYTRVQVEHCDFVLDHFHCMAAASCIKPLELLQSLTLISKMPKSASLQAVGRDGVVLDAPNLRYASIHGINGIISSTQLRTLEIAGNKHTFARLSANTFLETLRRSGSTLQSLTLRWAILDEVGDVMPVVLPSLSTLWMWGSASEANFVARNLRMPTVKTVTACVELYGATRTVSDVRTLVGRLLPDEGWDAIRIRINESRIRHAYLSLGISVWTRDQLSKQARSGDGGKQPARMNISMRSRAEPSWQALAQAILSQVTRTDIHLRLELGEAFYEPDGKLNRSVTGFLARDLDMTKRMSGDSINGRQQKLPVAVTGLEDMSALDRLERLECRLLELEILRRRVGRWINHLSLRIRTIVQRHGPHTVPFVVKGSGFEPHTNLARFAGQNMLHVPNLVSATLRGVFVTIFSNRLRFLEIDFTCVPQRVAPTMDDLRDTLIGAQHTLEELHLRPVNSSGSGRLRPVTLNALKLIELCGSPVQVSTVMNCISAPNVAMKRMKIGLSQRSSVTVAQQVVANAVYQFLTATALDASWDTLRLRIEDPDTPIVELAAGTDGYDRDGCPLSVRAGSGMRVILHGCQEGRRSPLPSWTQLTRTLLEGFRRRQATLRLEVPAVHCVARKETSGYDLSRTTYNKIGGIVLEKFVLSILPVST
ncbi:hypothetical protein PENSPDRAFT_667018 [Peniophora sp. CONT]|nr:hypothetical protein PENSPDRAFT_667018 [Peniophora sp. CONT]